MTKYKLYALPTKPETIEAMTGQRFSRVTPQYSLVYTDGDAPKGSAELSERDARRLSRGDESWLKGCNTQLIAEELQRQMPDMLRKMDEQVEKLTGILKELSEEAKAKEKTAEAD